MDNKFSGINVSAVTFTGLSLPYHRKIALIMSLAIWSGFVYLFVMFTDAVRVNIDIEEMALAAISAMLLNYIFGKAFFMARMAEWLVKRTPLGILYQQDKRVLNQAKAECLSIANRVKFMDYLEYSKINPAIRSKESAVVMAHQRKGDLQDWIKNVRNLKLLANLIYQMYLAELILQNEQDHYETP
ncbi:hypothetical protein [Alkalimarinus alittae]|uniref:ATP synthase protein MI25 n=1 Tax=Alkalimarinus alittae TaxID=2961619 RepID=A0ABY6N584_9ALTE|nr:hypothetical protein [Alkalimarinus alittae]UZE97287.1 hypothetical protein NKI27_05920 [Alkalimarinus alittae]